MHPRLGSLLEKERSTSMELTFLRRCTRVFKSNVIVEGGCFYIGRKRTVLETRDKRSRAYSSTDVESTAFYIVLGSRTTWFLTFSTMVILQTM